MARIVRINKIIPTVNSNSKSSDSNKPRNIARIQERGLIATPHHPLSQANFYYIKYFSRYSWNPYLLET